MAAGASMKTWLLLVPSISIFVISGNALYFGLLQFPENLSGTLNS